MSFDLGSFLTGGQATANLNPQGRYGGYLGDYLTSVLNNSRGPGLNFGQANNAYGQMQGLANQLSNVASGNMKGAGELAVDRTMQAGTAAQQAAANAARGANAALAMRQAARNQAGMALSGAGAAQGAALQDQANARNQLAGVLGGMQSGALQQQQLGLQGYQAQNQAQQGYLQQLMGLNQNGFNNQYQYNQANMADQGALPSLLQSGGSYLAGLI